MTRILRIAAHPVAVCALVVAVLAASVFAVTALRPAAVAVQPPATAIAPVSSTRLVCPDVSALGTESVTTLTAAAAPLVALPDAPAGIGSDGAATVEPLASEAAGADWTVDPLTERGPATSVEIRQAEAGAAIIDGSGALAPGLAAMQLTRTVSGETAGIAARTCSTPGTEFWFAGLATELGHRSRLVLTNAEQAAAEVHLEAYGPAGLVPIPSPDVVVPAGGTSTYDIDGLAPDEDALVVHVQVRVGRVVAGVVDQRVVGLVPHGTDWVAPSDKARRELVIAGVPGGTGSRVLHLLAPGDLDASVTVRLATSAGPLSPVGLESVDLVAGQVTEIPLDEHTQGEPVAVELSADEPIVAGVRAVLPAAGSGGKDAEDSAFVGVATALPAPTLVPDARVGDGWVSTLLLSSAGPATTAHLTMLSPAGDVVAEQDAEIPAGGTTAVELAPAGQSGSFHALIAPAASDTVYAVLQVQRTAADGAGVTLVPVVGEPLTVTVPRVRQDLSTGLRPRGG